MRWEPGEARLPKDGFALLFVTFRREIRARVGRFRSNPGSDLPSSRASYPTTALLRSELKSLFISGIKNWQ